MIYRHEVRIGGEPRADDKDILLDHQPDPTVPALTDIPRLFDHWDADWDNAVYLPESRIFYVITYQNEVPMWLSIWYEGGF
jgi:hypothetical protein